MEREPTPQEVETAIQVTKRYLDIFRDYQLKKGREIDITKTCLFVCVFCQSGSLHTSNGTPLVFSGNTCPDCMHDGIGDAWEGYVRRYVDDRRREPGQGSVHTSQSKLQLLNMALHGVTKPTDIQ